MRSALATALSVGRTGFGIAGLAAPGFFGQWLIGADATARGAKTMARVAAVRDLALGVGTLHALKRSRSETVGMLLALGTVCDATDLAIAVAGTRHLGGYRRLAFPLAAGSFALAGSACLALARPAARTTIQRGHDALR
jgi:hypothetical protein